MGVSSLTEKGFSGQCPLVQPRLPEETLVPIWTVTSPGKAGQHGDKAAVSAEARPLGDMGTTALPENPLHMWDHRLGLHPNTKSMQPSPSPGTQPRSQF